MLKVAVVGATGYTGEELLKVLIRHPQVEIAALCSRRDWMWRPRIDEVFPELVGRLDMPCEPIDPAALKGRADVAMLCVPHTVAMEHVPALLAAGLRVIDFSAEALPPFLSQPAKANASADESIDTTILFIPRPPHQ